MPDEELLVFTAEGEIIADVVVAHWSLAKALAANHRIDQARAEFEKALAGHERIQRQIPAEEGDNSLVVETRDWLARDRLQAGDRAGARKFYGANVALLAGSTKANDEVSLALTTRCWAMPIKQ